MFWSKYPYINLTDLNLDYLLRAVKEISDAKNVTFDDSVADLNADNVQAAIDNLKTLVDNIYSTVSAVVKIDDNIPAAYWSAGHTFTHLQTVNNVTLKAIIDAIKDDKVIILSTTENDLTTLYTLVNVAVDDVNMTHTLYLYDPINYVIKVVVINGLNDDANVYIDLSPSVTISVVNTFNGRDGAVVSQAGDYNASEIDYDNTVSGLTATDAQAAIDEIAADVPTSYVDSFNGRNGAVVPTAGDYDASDVDYDNTVSGLTATDVQAAIDEISNDVLSSGVASFKGRTGAVNPAAHDYDASMVDYDNTVSGLTATDVQAAIDELAGGGSVTITLTLNGAKEDTIVVTDSNNVTIGTCVFASGQTSGTLTANVASGYSDTWTFRSSVAKDTTTGTSDYSITATVDDTATQTVDVHPANTLYWYGNEFTGITGGWTGSDGYGTSTHTKNTNSLNSITTSNHGGSSVNWDCANNVNVPSTATFKANINGDITTQYLSGNLEFRFRCADGTFQLLTNSLTFDGIATLPNISTNPQVATNFDFLNVGEGNFTIRAIWYE